MNDGANLALVKNFLAAMMIERDMATAQSFLAGALLEQAKAGPGALSAVLDAVEDMRQTIEHVVETSDTVVIFSAWEARHTRGEVFGVAPTGKSLHFKSADGFRIENGKLVEHFDVVNATPMFMSLGLLHVGKTPR
jgi:predicted ester cyclase